MNLGFFSGSLAVNVSSLLCCCGEMLYVVETQLNKTECMDKSDCCRDTDRLAELVEV